VISFEIMVIFLSDKQFPRCMEHAVHLGAGHFIKVVSPTSAHTLVKKICKASHNTQLGDIDFDALEADLRGNDDDEQAEDDTDDEADDKAAVDFTVGDTIGKSLALVKQVSTSQYMQIIID
jgi:hypothetical protein